MNLQYLQKGDTISLIAPAGAIQQQEDIKNCINFFTKNGYKIKTGKNLFSKENYLAGTDQERLEDLHSAFLDKETKIILCARGGYGSARLLPLIDFELIKQNQKPIIGYSDITALLNNLPCPCFLGPMGASDFAQNPDTTTITSFFESLSNKQKIYQSSNFITINTGKAEGELIGGNLSVLCSLLGTKYQPNFENKILLIEDTNEPLYKIDRMLTQLQQIGIKNRIKGLIFADFDIKNDQNLINLLKDFSINIPTFLGFECSHQRTKYTIELHKNYILDADFGYLIKSC